MGTFVPKIVNALKALGGSFQPGELAYLALTQKMEHVVRDRLAFALHTSLTNEMETMVCREWKRFDLAIIQKAAPVLLLEAKALYSFDIYKNGKVYPYFDLMKQDIQKVRYLGHNNGEIFTLLLATHPHHAPSRIYSHAVKYFSQVCRHAVPGNTFEAAKAKVRQNVPGFNLAACDKIDAGSAFGVDVSIWFWLFGPHLVEGENKGTPLRRCVTRLEVD